MQKMLTFVLVIFVALLTGCSGPVSDGERIANLGKKASEEKDYNIRKGYYEIVVLKYAIAKETYSGDEWKAFEAAYVKAGGRKYYNP